MLTEQVVGPIGRSRLAFAVALAIAIGGCSSIRQSMSGLFGEKPPPTATPEAAQERQTYYAAAEGLAVHTEASASSKIVGRLALHEKVTRSRLERGYAYVTVEKRDLAGWVDNAQLTWRLPAAAHTAPGETEPATAGAPTPEAGGGAKTGEAVESETPPSPGPTPTTTPAARQPPPAQPPATPSPPSPSMFNPF